MGCVNTITKKLTKAGFKDIEVELGEGVQTLRLDLNGKSEDDLRLKLKTLGYPFKDEKLGKAEEKIIFAKSFASCAVGKITKD